jgi:hypothetical protein
MAVRLSALRAGRALPAEISYGTHFCWRMSKPRAMVRLEGLGKLKKCNDLIENRTRGLPTYSIVP